MGKKMGWRSPDPGFNAVIPVPLHKGERARVASGFRLRHPERWPRIKPRPFKQPCGCEATQTMKRQPVCLNSRAGATGNPTNLLTEDTNKSSQSQGFWRDTDLWTAEKLDIRLLSTAVNNNPSVDRDGISLYIIVVNGNERNIWESYNYYYWPPATTTVGKTGAVWPLYLGRWPKNAKSGQSC